MLYNVLSFGMIVAGLILIYRWIKDSFEGFRRWRCSLDGQFLFYLLLLVALGIVEIAVLVTLYAHDMERFIENLSLRFSKRTDDSFYIFFICIMVYTAINFAMTLFALFILEKMSHSVWSVSYKDDN